MASPTAALISLAEIKRYMELLYPDAPDTAWIVASWLAGVNDFRSQWFPVSRAADAALFLFQQASVYNTYLGLGLRHPTCAPGTSTRGSNTDVCAIAGLWVEFDHTGGTHTAPNLPTPATLMAFIQQLPCRFSLLIDSGGGLHAYLLFKELWMLDTPQDQADAALLIKRFQRTLQEQATARGWTIDSTADLARVLRPAGTINHKGSTPKPVMILDDDVIRYDPATLAQMAWLADIDESYVTPTGPGTFGETLLVPIETGCAWLAHCRDDAATLPEPEWYTMLGIVGRCDDGAQLAHIWSTPYPGYSASNTDKKLQHALASAGPRTCSAIRYDLGGESYCAQCPAWGHIKSPIVLGMPPNPTLTVAPSPIGWSVNGVPGGHIAGTVSPSWRQELFGKKNGELTQNLFNITQILRHHDHWRRPDNSLWWDEVGNTPMIGPAELTEQLEMKIAHWFGGAERLPITSKQMLHQCLIAACKEQPRDLLKIWLNTLPQWDTRPRLATWLTTIAGVEPTVYVQDVARLLLVSMVARAMEPGCLCRHVVILEGPEDAGKSKLVEALATQAWYVVLSIGLDTKDSHMMLQRAWVAEMAELDSLSKTEETRLKAFITMRHDSYIPKYSNFRESIPRRAIFVGTTNEESYLKGQTGNTRFLPVKVTKTIDVDGFQRIRDQLFAEALALYRGTPAWWEMSQVGHEAAKEERERRRLLNVYEQPLHEWLEYGRFDTPVFENGQPVKFIQNETSWPEIARWFLGLATPEHWKDMSLQKQIAQALKALEWHQAIIWRQGRTTKLWKKG